MLQRRKGINPNGLWANHKRSKLRLKGVMKAQVKGTNSTPGRIEAEGSAAMARKKKGTKRKAEAMEDGSSGEDRKDVDLEQDPQEAGGGAVADEGNEQKA
jgi:hypothetical protein